MRIHRRPKVRSARARRLRRGATGLALLLLVPVTWSYVGYLTAAGDAPVTVRTVDWLRDHGFDRVVVDVEQLYYSHVRPTGSAPDPGDLPGGRPLAGRVAPVGVVHWHEVHGLALPPADVQESYVVPDRHYRSVVATVVRLDQRAIRTVYVPGLKEPGGAFAWHGGVPRAHRHRLVAAFNAGYKMRDTTGGAWTEGRTAGRALEDGEASAVVYRDGHVDVAQWGRDATRTPDVVSVRQNLDLIVDGGRPVAGLSTDRSNRWGTTHAQMQYTWRSGMGIDAQGRLVYAAGHQMSMTELADALVDAGAVRAMQLDIHSGVVTFNWFREHGGRAIGTKLFPSMPRGADRFLAPDQRDFFAVEAT